MQPHLTGSEILAFDLKTRPLRRGGSGLDPAEAEVVSMAFFGTDGAEIFERGAHGIDSETALLSQAAMYLASRPTGEVLVGWNSSGFELPFLRRRFDAGPTGHRLLGPVLKESKRLSKYGDPVFDGTWQGHEHIDVAYYFEEFANTAQIRWGRRPVAVAFNLIPAAQEDVSHFSRYSKSQARAWALTDVRLTYQLATLAVALSSEDLHHLASK